VHLLASAEHRDRDSVRADEAPSHPYERAAYRERPVIERVINQWIAIRYDTLATSYVTMVIIACVLEEI